jgi:hypothetical protein
MYILLHIGRLYHISRQVIAQRPFAYAQGRLRRWSNPLTRRWRLLRALRALAMTSSGWRFTPRQ